MWAILLALYVIPQGILEIGQLRYQDQNSEVEISTLLEQ